MAEGEGDGLGDVDGDGLGDAEVLGDAEALGEGVTDGLADGLGEGLAEGLADGLGTAVGVGLLTTPTAGGGFRTAGRLPAPLPPPNGWGPGGLAAVKAMIRLAKAATAKPRGTAAIEERL